MSFFMPIMTACTAVVCIIASWAAVSARLSDPMPPRTRVDRGASVDFSKKIICWYLGNSTIWIYFSYALAFLGKEEIAESLTKQIVVSIAAVFIPYAAKSVFENLSKHNSWPDRPDTDQARRCLDDEEEI